MSLAQLESVSLPINLTEFDQVIDVRTPKEFEEDHLPGAQNLPVLTNEQRVEVGTLYKESSFKARRLGARYVSESIANHLAGPLRNTDQGWTPLIYCWRGGQRSAALASVLRSIGWRARTLEGGYKAYRRFVIEDLGHQLSNATLQFRVISGLTGVGKTILLSALEETGQQVVDLEGLANHRGSLLGSMGLQPNQRRFETLLHAKLSELDPSRPVYLEAESNRIGSVNIPLFDVMKSLIGSDDAGTLHSAIVLEFRLPRTATAAFAGASLAAAGLMMQTVFRNPLADPFVLGVNSGASLGVAIALLVLGPGGIALASQTPLTGSLLVVVAATIGAGASLGLILILSRRVDVMSLLILGLMISYGVSSIVSILIYYSMADRLQVFLTGLLGILERLPWAN